MANGRDDHGESREWGSAIGHVLCPPDVRLGTGYNCRESCHDEEGSGNERHARTRSSLVLERKLAIPEGLCGSEVNERFILAMLLAFAMASARFTAPEFTGLMALRSRLPVFVGCGSCRPARGFVGVVVDPGAFTADPGREVDEAWLLPALPNSVSHKSTHCFTVLIVAMIANSHKQKLRLLERETPVDAEAERCRCVVTREMQCSRKSAGRKETH